MEPSNTNRPSEHAISFPASPTGWEYYLIIRTDSESSPGEPIYRKRVISVDPRIECGTLDTLDENQFDVIESLLKERNARTAEDGQWVLTELSVAGGSFRFRIGFHGYGALADCRERNAFTFFPLGSKRGAEEDEPTVTGNQQPQPTPPPRTQTPMTQTKPQWSLGPPTPSPSQIAARRRLGLCQ